MVKQGTSPERKMRTGTDPFQPLASTRVASSAPGGGRAQLIEQSRTQLYDIASVASHRLLGIKSMGKDLG